MLLLGLTALGWCGAVLLQARAYRRRAKEELGQIVLTRRGRLAAPSKGSLLGSIEIPRVAVSSIVLEGTDPGVLRLGVGHIPDTVLPWRAGNVALAGHRDSFFRGLRKIHKDDKIRLTTPEGSYDYSVTWTRVVGPNQTEVLDPSDRPTLTLITCYPFDYVGPAPRRFVVRAQRIQQ